MRGVCRDLSASVAVVSTFRPRRAFYRLPLVWNVRQKHSGSGSVLAAHSRLCVSMTGGMFLCASETHLYTKTPGAHHM